MKYSIIIPYYDPEYRKKKLITDLVKSIVLCSQEDEYELVIVKDGPSYVESHNIGLKNAQGEYLVILNDDIVIEDKDWLKKMTQDEGISSYHLGQSHSVPYALPDATCFLMPRKVFEKLGLMNDEYKHGFNFEDTDYFMTARELGIPFFLTPIEARHKGQQTEQYFPKLIEMIEKNKQLFNSRWLGK